VVNVNNATLTITCGAPSTPTAFEGNISGTGVVTAEAAYVGAPASYFDNSGIIAMSGTASGFVAADTGGEVTNSGTIQVAGGVLELTPSELTNTGVIELLDGTLKLDGDLTVLSLTEFTDPGSNLWVQGTLDLGGGTLSPGVGGTPLFALYGDVRDGKVVISSGITFSAYGDAIFMAPVVNSGTLDAFGLTAGGNITGTGTINLGGLLQLKASTGAGQLVNFISGSGGDLDFSTSAAATSFAGTIGTIGNGDTIGFAPLNGALLIGGSVAGDAIIAKFSNGATISLATKSQWTGSFTVDSAGLEYHTAAPSLADWSLPISSGSDQEAALSEARGALPQTAPAALDWFLPLHAR
jgi:hypothetical protein